MTTRRDAHRTAAVAGSPGRGSACGPSRRGAGRTLASVGDEPTDDEVLSDTDAHAQLAALRARYPWLHPASPRPDPRRPQPASGHPSGRGDDGADAADETVEPLTLEQSRQELDKLRRRLRDRPI